ncbi:S-adenosyl-L-methionine-dependent methyltransferase [Obelidium mucronatum]|nr:S-adenosyl-L-methionine-dependent methyltransferase [Obelidium mucronatum]
MSKPTTVLELYSGIGGHHAAYCKLFGIDPSKTKSTSEEGDDQPHPKFYAYDVNANANTVYAYNFPTDEPPSSRDISQLTVSDFEQIGATLWVMSPPCQPYTRNGSRLESTDPRSHSFLKLIQELPKMTQPTNSTSPTTTPPPPTHILLENVLGFETSDTFQILCKVLRNECGYALQGYIINPIDCGVPNSRPRFYLLAKKKKTSGASGGSGGDDEFGVPENTDKFNNPPTEAIGGLSAVKQPHEIRDYLDKNHDDDETSDSNLQIPHRKLWKAAEQFDILRPSHRRSCCFTKGYGKFARGTGSVLCMASDDEILEAAKKYGFEEGGKEDNDGNDSIDSSCSLTQLNWEGVASEQVQRALKHLFSKYFELRKKWKPTAQEKGDQEHLTASGKPKKLSAKRKREIDMERGSWPDQLEACPLAALKLRYFSVKEVARLQGFPEWFAFPDTVTQEQGWKLLGNSINVFIVERLLSYLLK